MSERPRVGVSSCLLGHLVRYDGASKAIPWVHGELASLVDLVPICPEVGAGMSVPRPAIQLVERDSGRRYAELASGNGDDVHTALQGFCSAMKAQLTMQQLHGYIFKARSPSCGVVDTPYFSESGEILRHGPGMWAETLIKHWPDLPVADESCVGSDAGREEFLARVWEFWRRARLED